MIVEFLKTNVISLTLLMLFSTFVQYFSNVYEYFYLLIKVIYIKKYFLCKFHFKKYPHLSSSFMEITWTMCHGLMEDLCHQLDGEQTFLNLK